MQSTESKSEKDNGAKNVQSILHVTVGIPGVWEPTDEELNLVHDMFTDALDNPKGSVVTTRSGVTTCVLPLDDETSLEVVNVRAVQVDTRNTLRVNMPIENMSALAERLDVTTKELYSATINDANGNELYGVQSIDLATGEALINIATAAATRRNPAISWAVRRDVDDCLEPIVSSANLCGCYLTFAMPTGNALGIKDMLIPVERLLHEPEHDTEACDTKADAESKAEI